MISTARRPYLSPTRPITIAPNGREEEADADGGESDDGSQRRFGGSEELRGQDQGRRIGVDEVVVPLHGGAHHGRSRDAFLLLGHAPGYCTWSAHDSPSMLRVCRNHFPPPEHPRAGRSCRIDSLP